jgi:ligand-binding sensor domain-containing protein/serine phosphatase RsbU (regulator of sigma subunit)
MIFNSSPVFVRIIRLKKRIIFFCSILFLTCPLLSQSYYFDNYGVEEGLSSSKVYVIIQDSQDFIWLGTESGVSRFDGVVFENFTSEQGLAENGVFSLLEDSKGNIWFGHLDGGISRFSGEEFEILTFDTIVINNDITSITETAENQMWFTTSSSGAILVSNPYGDLNAVQAQNFKGKEGLSDKVFGSTTTKDGTFYCLTDVGIKKYVKEEDSFESFLLEDLTKYWMKTTMFEDSKGNLWFGTYNGGLYKYEADPGRMIIYDKRDGLSKNWISCITENSDGEVWVGTWGGGITRFRGNTITRVYNPENGLDATHIQCIVEDQEGNMLIGSQFHGLSIFKGEQFITITTDDGLGDKNVWAVYQDQQRKLWFGTNEGISVYDPSRLRGENFVYYNRDNNLIGDKIRFIREDRNHNLWIGTDGSGVYQYLPEEGSFVFDTYLNKNLHSDQIIKALEVDANNNLWIGTNDGLGFWEIEKKQGRIYTQMDGLVGNEITALYIDSKGNLWIGSDKKKGLTKFNMNEGMFIKSDLGREIAPKSISEDKDGKLWIATTIGLFVISEDTIVSYYTQNDGLLANNITVVNVDDKNNIYIGTNIGLNKFNQSEGKMYTYTRKNGYVGIETKNNASFKDNDGNMWFGTANGVTYYNPELEKKEVMEPLTHIRGMQVNYHDRLMLPGMKLKHTEKSIIFDYYSICLTNPDVVRYQIMLEGADANWRPVTQQKRAIYSALSPNKYIFKVKAKNNAGIWNTEPVFYNFTIKPPFYQTWWFITSCIVVAIISIFVFIKAREKKLIRENRILEEKVAERTAEVVQKSKELEEKNKDITDSIRYAKRIQNAILPPEDAFAETFILFKPKDIVSGDFYWLAVTEKKQFVAAVDCTGHGVPGAFMSIIGYNSLNKIIKEYEFEEPAAILDQLNDDVSSTLQQQSEEDEVKDGMDIALIAYNLHTRELEFAGAYNPLYLIRDGELTEIKGDRFAIGRSSIKVGQKFTNHKLELKPNDITYIFSDGYADQFGGTEGKKLKSKAVKDILLSIQDLSMQEQKDYLDKKIIEWRGSLPQIDDILVIGSKVR